jgi:ABC transport system ATP-binding/permease protein
MEVRLVLERRKQRRVLPLPETVTTLGRSRGCTLRIPVNTVSRSHCRLHKIKVGFVVVEDLRSTNGTRLNGNRVEGTQVVRPGDRLKVGPVTFVVEYELTPAALEALRAAETDTGPRVRLDEGAILPSPHTGRETKTETGT